MGPATKSAPELAHVLFMDIVGSSKLPTDVQRTIIGRLEQVVSESAEFQRAKANDELISLPTGDGMALAFFNKLDAGVLCAIEVTKAIQAESLCQIRMGVHTGPVFITSDINGNRNLSGAGINVAERVMSCGEAGHILLSDTAAESLRQLSAWRSQIQPVGECQVKDGWIRLWNLVDGPIGNPELPKKSKQRQRHRQRLLLAGEAALALAVIATMGVAFWTGFGRMASYPGQNQASIAVLPFEDLSPENNQEYFSEGLAEELINGLATTPGLRVVARTSSFQFRNKGEDSRIIGDRLNVATILEGSVRKQGSRCRIAVELIKAADGIEIWSQTFDGELSDIFAVQQEISSSVAKQLKLKLLANKHAASVRSTNVEAYNAYLYGRYFLDRKSKEGLTAAINYFEQAINLDGNYAPAWVGLGLSRIRQADATPVSYEEGYAKARDAAAHALTINPDLGEAHAALGWIKMLHDWDWPGADASYRRALAIEPDDTTSLRGAGSLARLLGRFDEAIARYRRATQIDPLTANSYQGLGFMLYYAGRQQEAKIAFEKSLELVPEMEVTHCGLAQVYLALSRPAEALAEAQKEPNPEYRLQALALAYHALGRDKESDAKVRELIQKFQQDASFQIAEAYAYRDDKVRAFEWLEQAYSSHDNGLTEMTGDPLLKSLEHDRRYMRFRQKMRLPL